MAEREVRERTLIFDMLRKEKSTESCKREQMEEEILGTDLDIENEIISEQKPERPDEFVASTNAYDSQESTLQQVAINNENIHIASKLLRTPESSDQSPKWSFDQLKRLKNAAKLHSRLSVMYLHILRRYSKLGSSKKNPSPWRTLKEGSYYLRNAAELVKWYKEYTPGTIEDENMKLISDTLVGLEFDQMHISEGYTDEAYHGKAKCFISKGQGKMYYRLLHSKYRENVILFIEKVERDIDVPVKRFLESLEQNIPVINLE